MTHDEFSAAGARIYGLHGWRTQLATRLGLRRETISRYASGHARIPPAVELALQTLEANFIAERTA
jgi:transcriptional regulator with XRE-family HTH domain